MCLKMDVDRLDVFEEIDMQEIAKDFFKNIQKASNFLEPDEEGYVEEPTRGILY